MSIESQLITSASDLPEHTNLVSDSVLVEEAIKLLRVHGGRMAATELADRVLQISNLDAEIASHFIRELVGDDARLRVAEDGEVELINLHARYAQLDETDFVIVDVETTGARASDCRITEIGAYRVKGGEIVDEFATLVNPRQPIPAFIQSLTGITNRMVADAPTFAEVVPAWLRFAGRAVLVAHNAPFDVRFINTEVARVYPNRRMMNQHLCTVNLSRRFVPGLENYRLHTVAEFFSITIQNRHRAAGDAHATARIFLQLLERMRERDIKTLADVRFKRD